MKSKSLNSNKPSQITTICIKRFTIPLWKDLSPIANIVSAQETSSILKIVFALSERPHLHEAYLVS